MTQQELTNIFKAISTANISETRKDEAVTTVLNLASQAFTKEVMQSLLAAKDSDGVIPQEKKVPQTKKCGKAEKGLTFTKKEIKSMPQKYQHIFAQDGFIIPYRLRKDGVFEARLRRKDVHIEVSAKDFGVLKEKVFFALHKSAEPPKPVEPVKKGAQDISFTCYVNDWLLVKQKTIKPSTFKEYSRLCTHDIIPYFTGKTLAEIDRQQLQTFLYSYIDKGKNRTAEKLYDLLRCIFDVASDDFDMKSPMAKVVLPKYQTKKGSAFTKEEERKLVEYCRQNTQLEASSAILALLYFGMRYSELKTMKVLDDNWLQIETSKERLGQDIALRYAPFTPMVKRNLPYIDFEKARRTNQRTIASTIKRLFPNHHPHELRYTYITRCKECGVNPELVMLWDGHSADKDVVASRVDRGYTDFSKEHQLKEAAKVDYKL